MLQFFGRYVGTVRDQGLRWANPLYTKRRISLRVRNFETERSKVNDTDGNPIELPRSSSGRWSTRPRRPSRWTTTSTTSTSRASRGPQPGDPPPLRHAGGGADLAARQHRGDRRAVADRDPGPAPQGRRRSAEARITHLAYAPEIASAMLQRQQAGAIIAARGRIVDGAVSMVEMALDSLSKRQIVELTRSARPPWSAICSSCCAGTRPPSRW